MELDFGQKQDGFQIKGTTLKGFTIAGPDRVFYPAEAMVQNGKIIVFSPEVSIPLAARYGWADNPDCNLYGENGLPVASFPDRLLVDGVSLNLFSSLCKLMEAPPSS